MRFRPDGSLFHKWNSLRFRSCETGTSCRSHSSASLPAGGSPLHTGANKLTTKKFIKRFTWCDLIVNLFDSTVNLFNYKIDGRSFREFAAERFTLSSRNQKQSCRAIRGLSIGTYLIATKTKHNLHFFTFFTHFFVSHGKKKMGRRRKN